MSPPTQTYEINIRPTYLSTDLITPGRLRRETLPAIGVHLGSLHEPKLWGQETKETPNGTLAYHHFKPSHLQGNTVVVTHRHYSNRISNMEAKQQPAVITNLLLSKCRPNDQRMPPPFQSSLIQEHYIPEPCPEYLRNSYFSHRCKFQVYPTDGVDLRDAAVRRPSSVKKKPPTTATSKALKEIKSKLYDTTTYRHNFELSKVKKERPKSCMKIRAVSAKRTVRFNVNLEICKNCGLKIKRDCKDNLNEANQQSKYERTCRNESKKPFWPTWPLGVKNITNNQPAYPKVILPKFCIHPKKESIKVVRYCSCTNRIPTIVSRAKTPCQRDDTREKTSCKKDATEDQSKDTTGRGMAEEFENTSKQKTENSRLEKKQSISRNTKQRPLSRIQQQRGFKTEAHRRFHQIYNDIIPDLRDATTEGRKHNFHGFNAHLFRG